MKLIDEIRERIERFHSQNDLLKLVNVYITLPKEVEEFERMQGLIESYVIQAIHACEKRWKNGGEWELGDVANILRREGLSDWIMLEAMRAASKVPQYRDAIEELLSRADVSYTVKTAASRRLEEMDATIQNPLAGDGVKSEGIGKMSSGGGIKPCINQAASRRGALFTR
ncbi:MAG: hypothetical protein AABX38_06780 [Candidatus Micrarchaeota archaeon]